MERANRSAPASAGDDARRGRAASPTCGAPPYRPRRPQAPPLDRVLASHFAALERVHEEFFEPTHGPPRTAARRAVPGEWDAVPGLVVCLQTFGSVAHFHPHLRVLMSDGAFRRDGRFVRPPEPEPAMLDEAWRRSVLAESVRRGWLGGDAAAAMLGWPHSGFGGVHGTGSRSARDCCGWRATAPGRRWRRRGCAPTRRAPKWSWRRTASKAPAPTRAPDHGRERWCRGERAWMAPAVGRARAAGRTRGFGGAWRRQLERARRARRRWVGGGGGGFARRAAGTGHLDGDPLGATRRRVPVPPFRPTPRVDHRLRPARFRRDTAAVVSPDDDEVGPLRASAGLSCSGPVLRIHPRFL